MSSGTPPALVEANPEYFGDFWERSERRAINKNQIYKRPENYLSVIRTSGAKVVDAYRNRKEHPVNIIYSQWRGYLDPSRWESMQGAEMMAGFQDDKAIKFHYIHTSGHANLDQLKVFAEAINARKLVPVHTESADHFEKFFKNVSNADDGHLLI